MEEMIPLQSNGPRNSSSGKFNNGVCLNPHTHACPNKVNHLHAHMIMGAGLNTAHYHHGYYLSKESRDHWRMTSVQYDSATYFSVLIEHVMFGRQEQPDILCDSMTHE